MSNATGLPMRDPLPRVPRRRRAINVEAAYWVALAGVVAFFAVSLGSMAHLTTILALIGGAPFLAGAYVLVGAMADFPAATRREWREQLALAGIAERAWWNAGAGSLLRQSMLPALVAQLALVATFYAREPHIRRDLYDLFTLGMLLPATGCLVSGLGGAMAFRALCRRPSSAFAATAPWIVAGMLLPGAAVAACVVARIDEDIASNASAVLFVATSFALAAAWRRGWRGILAFE